MSNAAMRESDGLQHATSTTDRHKDRRVRAFASFVVGIVLGCLTWIFSLAATGQAEPWDAAGFYYIVCLMGAGFISTLVYSRSCLYGTLGVYLGQAAYMMFRSTPGDPSVLPALLSLALFGLIPAFFGSLIPFVTRKLREIKRRRTAG